MHDTQFAIRSEAGGLIRIDAVEIVEGEGLAVGEGLFPLEVEAYKALPVPLTLEPRTGGYKIELRIKSNAEAGDFDFFIQYEGVPP